MVPPRRKTPLPGGSTPAEERAATEAAIAEVAAHTNEEWRGVAMEAVAAVARRLQPFTTEDVWLYLREHFPDAGVHNNKAMGPIMRAAQKAGWIEKTDSHRAAEQMAHNRPMQLWRSRYGG